MRRKHLRDRLWAALLSAHDPHIGVVRVPDIRVGVNWWKGMAGYEVRARDRFGDLGVALGRTKDGTVLLIVGGPGAFEVPSSDLQCQAPTRTARLVDPWGNAIGLAEQSGEDQRPRPHLRFSQEERS
ncbi:MAG: hypothetical protein ABWX92_04290 [Mycetocola sp.]